MTLSFVMSDFMVTLLVRSLPTKRLLSLRKDSVLLKMGRYLSTSLSGGPRRAKLTWIVAGSILSPVTRGLLLSPRTCLSWLLSLKTCSEQKYPWKILSKKLFVAACIASFEKYIFRQHPKDISFKSSENGKKESKYTRLTTKSLQWRTKTK